MKLRYFTLLTLVTTVLAKNVVDLDKFVYYLQDDKDQLDKRDAKKVVNLNKFKQDKRKNVVNINDFLIEKRDAKNVFDLSKLQQFSQDDSITKREEQQQILKNHVLFTIDDVDCYTNLLQSILPQIKSISIFAGYIRDNELLNSKTEFINETMVIVAPTNSAIENKLSGLKPWEFPNSISNIKDEYEQEKVLQQNLENFLNGHIITNFEKKLIVTNDSREQIIIVPLNNGKLIKIKQDLITDKFKIKLDNDWIDVVLVKQVENGFVFVIDECLVKPN